MKRETLDKHLRKVLREAQKAYRAALAAQVRGQEDGAAWAEFHEADRQWELRIRDTEAGPRVFRTRAAGFIPA